MGLDLRARRCSAYLREQPVEQTSQALQPREHVQHVAQVVGGEGGEVGDEHQQPLDKLGFRQRRVIQALAIRESHSSRQFSRETMIVAIPLGLMSAVFLTQYASPRLRRWMKPILEILA